MDARAEAQGGLLDTIKLLGATAVLVVSVVAFYLYEEASTLLRVLGILAALGVAAFLAFTTVRGAAIWDFFQESRNEVRKVVWPTRQETVQTTLIVFAMVLVMGIILWLFDMMLMSIVRYLTGQGG